MTPTTQSEASAFASMRGLTVREMSPRPATEFLRCQIIDAEDAVTVRFNDGRGNMCVHTFNPLRLVAFGRTWSDALAMMEGGRR